MFVPIPRLLLFAAVTCLVPAAPTVRDEVDVIELNHVCDDEGRVVLHQLIFWEWRGRAAGNHVVAWRLWRVGGPRPVRDWRCGGYVLVFPDGEVLRYVQASVYRETWTQYDPEIDDRRLFAQDQRRGLSRLESPAIDTGGSHSRP